MSVTLASGTSSRLTAGTLSPAIASNGAFSIGARVRWTSLSSYNAVIGLDGPVGYRIIDRQANATDLNFTHRNDTTSTYATSQQTGIVINTWYHVVMTWDTSTLKSYVNGSLIDSIAAAQSDSNNFDSFFFGNLDGSLQDGFVYSAAIDAAEVMQLYLDRRPRRRTNLVGQWPMFPGTVRVTDYAGRGNTLTPTGSPADGVEAPVGWHGAMLPAIKQLSTAIALSGSAAAGVSATAAINVTLPLSGSAVAAVSADAGIFVDKAISGTATAGTSAVATVGVEKSASGTAASGTSATAVVVQNVQPASAAGGGSGASAALSVAQAVAGAASGSVSADGGISVVRGLSNVAAVGVSATAAINMDMPIGAGTVGGAVSATAAITVATSIGVGAAGGGTSATAGMTVAIGLAGDAVSGTAADGGITKSGYTSAPTVGTSATASVSVAKSVSGVAAGGTSATAAMTVDVALSGSAAIGAGAGSQETIYLGLTNGLAQSGTAATAIMSKEVALSGDASMGTASNAYGRTAPLPQRSVRVFVDDAPTEVVLKMGGDP